MLSANCCIIDPMLANMSGHHFNANLALSKAAANIGLTYVNLVDIDADENVIKEGFLPHFRQTGYSKLWQIYQCQNLDCAQAISDFEAQLCAAEINLDGNSPLLLFPTVLHFHISGIAIWLSTKDLSKHPNIIIWSLFNDELMADIREQKSFARDEFVRAFQLLEAVERKGARIMIIYETAAMRGFLEEITNLPSEMHRPNCAYHANVKRYSKKHRAIPGSQVSYLGHVSVAKGFEFLPDIIEFVWRTHPQTRFLIQVNIPYPTTAMAVATKKLMQKDDRIELKFGALDPEEYNGLLADSDLLLLPYDPATYAAQGSGIFDEASAAGVPMVVPARASFAQHGIERGYCKGFFTQTANEIGRAVREALGDLQYLTKAGNEEAENRPSGLEELETLLKRVASGSPSCSLGLGGPLK